MMELTNHEKIMILELAIHQEDREHEGCPSCAVDYKQIYKDIIELLKQNDGNSRSPW